MKRNKKVLRYLALTILVILGMTLCVGASEVGGSGNMSSAITNVGNALTGVIGYMSQVTSAILTDNLWLLGMGFFVLMFIAGFVMYLFRVGRR